MSTYDAHKFVRGRTSAFSKYLSDEVRVLSPRKSLVKDNNSLLTCCQPMHSHRLTFSIQQTKTKMKFFLTTTSLLFATASAFSPAATRSLRTTSLKMGLSQDELKKQVGYKAVDDYVKSGTVIGLGTGSTAYYAVERVGELLKSGELKDILAIPTSIRTKEQAESLGIPLVTLDTHSKLDVAIDGADEVDPNLNLVKGGGGALLREKMVEICADKFIVIGKS